MIKNNHYLTLDQPLFVPGCMIILTFITNMLNCLLGNFCLLLQHLAATDQQNVIALFSS